MALGCKPGVTDAGVQNAQETNMTSSFDLNLAPNTANYAALTPLGFIARTAEVYPERLAIVHGDLRQSWAQPMRVAVSWPAACRKSASARTTRWP
jgi:hypothetical protein